MESRKWKPILILALAALWSCCAGCHAQQEAPQESIARVQDMYGRLWEGLLEVNDYFWHRGEYERCIATLRLITSMNPYDTEAYSNGAWLMQNQLRDDEAEVYLREGLANNADVYDLYFDLGYFYYMHGRFPESIADLENAVIFDDAPAFAWHLLAHAYEHAGAFSESLNIWFRQEAVEPENLVPGMQIERILEGGQPSNAPEMARHAREERMKDERP